MSFIEVYGKSTVYKNKITIPKDVRKYFSIKDGDKLIWIIDKDGDLIIRKTSLDKMKSRFQSF